MKKKLCQYVKHLDFKDYTFVEEVNRDLDEFENQKKFKSFIKNIYQKQKKGEFKCLKYMSY